MNLRLTKQIRADNVASDEEGSVGNLMMVLYPPIYSAITPDAIAVMKAFKVSELRIAGADLGLGK